MWAMRSRRTYNAIIPAAQDLLRDADASIAFQAERPQRGPDGTAEGRGQHVERLGLNTSPTVPWASPSRKVEHMSFLDGQE